MNPIPIADKEDLGLESVINPIVDAAAHIMTIDGKPWLSSVALAEWMGWPNKNLLDRIYSLDVGAKFLAVNFRGCRTTDTTGLIWISRDGFELLSRAFVGSATWHGLGRAAFAEFNRRHPPKRSPITPSTGFSFRYWLRCLGIPRIAQ